MPAEAPALQVAHLEQQLEQIKRVLSRKQIELSKFSTERDMFTARLAERDARIRELEEQLAKHGAPRVEQMRQAELQVRVRELEQELAKRGTSENRQAQLEARIRELEMRITAEAGTIEKLRQELAEALAWQPPPEDDLKRIHGIGPVFEAALKKMGIRTFEQIAAWSQEEVLRVAERLKVNPVRIQRYDWIAGARELLGRSGGRLP